MALDKKDVSIIEKIVQRSAESIKTSVTTDLRKEIAASAENVKTDLRKEIAASAENVKTDLRKEIAASEGKIIKVISREINDLAEINHMFIDKHVEHEKRIKRLEIKTGVV